MLAPTELTGNLPAPLYAAGEYVAFRRWPLLWYGRVQRVAVTRFGFFYLLTLYREGKPCFDGVALERELSPLTSEEKTRAVFEMVVE